MVRTTNVSDIQSHDRTERCHICQQKTMICIAEPWHVLWRSASLVRNGNVVISSVKCWQITRFSDQVQLAWCKRYDGVSSALLHWLYTIYCAILLHHAKNVFALCHHRWVYWSPWYEHYTIFSERMIAPILWVPENPFFYAQSTTETSVLQVCWCQSDMGQGQSHTCRIKPAFLLTWLELKADISLGLTTSLLDFPWALSSASSGPTPLPWKALICDISLQQWLR